MVMVNVMKLNVNSSIFQLRHYKNLRGHWWKAPVNLIWFLSNEGLYYYEIEEQGTVKEQGSLELISDYGAQRACL